MKTIPTGIAGLDLLLGGGLRFIDRMEENQPSAVVLIRGAPGVGKTVLATQIAAHISQEAKTDIAYACVELLPTELRAQLEGFPKSPVLQHNYLSPFVPELIKSKEPALFI